MSKQSAKARILGISKDLQTGRYKQKQTGFTVKLNAEALAALDRWRESVSVPISRNAAANHIVKAANPNLCASNPKRGGEGNHEGK